MTIYWGAIDYFATGEGRTIWYYIDAAKSEEEFKQKMFKELDIPEYYQIGVEVQSEVDEHTPLVIFEHWRMLVSTRDGVRNYYGHLSYHMHFNYS